MLPWRRDFDPFKGPANHAEVCSCMSIMSGKQKNICRTVKDWKMLDQVLIGIGFSSFSLCIVFDNVFNLL